MFYVERAVNGKMPQVEVCWAISGTSREASMNKAVSEGERFRGPAGAVSCRALWVSIKVLDLLWVSGGPWQGFEERDTA